MRLFVIEGIDGAGKTTVARALADRHGAAYYKTPPDRLSRERSRYECPGREMERFRFYLRALRVASEELRAILRTSDVVCDRYWLSTIVYHEALLSSHGRRVSLEPCLQGLRLVRPAATVVLHASEDTIRHRLERRRIEANAGGGGVSQFDARLEGDRRLQRRILRGYVCRVSSSCMVDTTAIRLDGVIARCERSLGMVPAAERADGLHRPRPAPWSAGRRTDGLAG